MAKLPVRLPHVGPRMRKVLHGVGLFFLALITFVFAFQAVFPYDRVRTRIEEIAGKKVDLTIDKVERSIIPGRFFLHGVTLKTRPSQSELDTANAIADAKEREKALALLSSTLYIEELEVDLGIVGLIGGEASVDFTAKIEAGRIKGNVTASKRGTSLRVVGVDVPSQQLPMREVLSNLPMAGEVEFALELDLPNEKLKTGKTGPDWTKAEGFVEFQCVNGCTIGDGKAKLKLKAKNARSQAFAGDGTAFGKINVASLLARVDISDSKLKVTKFDTKSGDVELHLDFEMQLAQVLDQSTVDGCIRFKGTEALRRREPKTADAISLTGAARHTDGLDHIRLEGTFKQVLKRAKVCGPGVGGSKGTGRPNLTVHEDDKPSPRPRTPPPVHSPVTIDAGVATDAALYAPTPAKDSRDGTGAGSAGSGSGSAAHAPTEGSAAPEQPDGAGSGSGSIQ